MSDFNWNKFRCAYESVLFYALLLVIFCVALFPFGWALTSSVRIREEVFTPTLLPQHFTLQTYLDVFTQQPFGRNLLNSLFVATSSVALSFIIGVFAAYALGRQNFRGRGFLLMSILAVSMFPQIAVLSGLYMLILKLGLYNQGLGLVFSYLIFTLPFTTWMLTTFMQTIPRGLEEAAIMDGTPPWAIVVKIFMPLLGPAFVTTGLLCFIFAWNEFLFALTLTMSDQSRTVPVAIALMSGSSSYELPWAHIMAAAVIVTVPLVALVLIFQKRIVSGLTAGAMKA